jgi:hypothetical protein
MPEKLSQGPRIGYDSRVAAGLSRGPNTKKTMVAAAWSGTWPAPQATLDLDFANNRGFVRGLGQGGVMDGITFTRASNGTFVGEDGLLKGFTQGGLNLLTFPQDFDNAAWIKDALTVATNAEIAPDGTLTAEKITPSSGTVAPRIYRAGLGSFSATASVYLKAGGFNYATLSLYNGSSYAFVYVDLTNGSIIQDTIGGATVSDAGNGWYRIVASYASFSTAFTVGVVDTSSRLISVGVGTATIAGNGTSGIFIWGAQLELGSTATEYFPTNINVPRFDWAGTEVVARRNLLTHTEDFTNAVWGRAGTAPTVTANAVTAPNGTATADRLAFTASGIANRLQQNTATATGNIEVTLSVYLRGDAGGEVMLVSTGQWVSSDLTLTTDWQRFTFSTTGVTSANFLLYAKTGTPTVYAWGAQSEIGSSATDYQAVAQPTTTTPLRPAPTCNGLLIEEARTNRLLWCRDATDAAWGKTDITAAKDQTGIDGVANAASSLTATADGGTCIQTITLASGSRTGSVYLKRLTGTGTVQVSLDGSTWSTVDLSTDEWRRIVLSGTVTNPVVGIKLAVSGDAVAMDFGQVEDGAFATSPVLTTGASATRSADVATVGRTNDWYDVFNGTFAVVFDTSYRGIAFENNVFTFGNQNGTYSLSTSASGNYGFGVAFGDNLISSFGTIVINKKTAIAVGYAKENNGASQDSGIAVSSNISIPNIRPNNLQIGSGSNRPLNGRIRRIMYFDKRFSNSALQELAT